MYILNNSKKIKLSFKYSSILYILISISIYNILVQVYTYTSISNQVLSILYIISSTLLVKEKVLWYIYVYIYTLTLTKELKSGHFSEKTEGQKNQIIGH